MANITTSYSGRCYYITRPDETPNYSVGLQIIQFDSDQTYDYSETVSGANITYSGTYNVKKGDIFYKVWLETTNWAHVALDYHTATVTVGSETVNVRLNRGDFNSAYSTALRYSSNYNSSHVSGQNYVHAGVNNWPYPKIIIGFGIITGSEYDGYDKTSIKLDVSYENSEHKISTGSWYTYTTDPYPGVMPHINSRGWDNDEQSVPTSGKSIDLSIPDSVRPVRGYTLSYNKNGGDGTLPSQQNAVITPTLGTNTLTKADSTPVDKNFTVSFYSGDTKIKDISTTGGKQITRYSANGWLEGSTNGTYRADGATVTLTGDTVYYANFSSQSIIQTAGTVAFNGTNPTKQGYTLLGWSTNKSATTATYTINGNISTKEDISVYAIYVKNISADDIVVTPSNDVSGSIKNNYGGDVTVYGPDGVKLGTIPAGESKSYGVESGDFDLKNYIENRGNNNITLKFKDPYGNTTTKTVTIKIPLLISPSIVSSTPYYWSDNDLSITCKNNSTIDNKFTIKFIGNQELIIFNDESISSNNSSVKNNLKIDTEISSTGGYDLKYKQTDKYTNLIIENGNTKKDAFVESTLTKAVTVSLPTKATISIPENIYQIDNKSLINIPITFDRAISNSKQPTVEIKYSNSSNVSGPFNYTVKSFDYTIEESYYTNEITITAVSKYNQHDCGSDKHKVKFVKTPTINTYRYVDFVVPTSTPSTFPLEYQGSYRYISPELRGFSPENYLSVTYNGQNILENVVNNNGTYYIVLNTGGLKGQTIQIVYASKNLKLTAIDKVNIVAINDNQFDILAQIEKGGKAIPVSGGQTLKKDQQLVLDNIGFTSSEEDVLLAHYNLNFGVNKYDEKQLDGKIELTGLCERPTIELFIDYENNQGITQHKNVSQDSSFDISIGMRGHFKLTNSNLDDESVLGPQRIYFAFSDSDSITPDQVKNSGYWLSYENNDGSHNTFQEEFDYNDILKSLTRKYQIYSDNNSLLFDNVGYSKKQVEVTEFKVYYVAEKDDRPTPKVYKATYYFKVDEQKFQLINENSDKETLVTGGYVTEYSSNEQKKKKTIFSLYNNSWTYLTDRTIKYNYDLYYRVDEFKNNLNNTNIYLNDYSNTNDKKIVSKNTGVTSYIVDSSDYVGEGGYIDFEVTLPFGYKDGSNSEYWETIFETYFYNNKHKQICEFYSDKQWKCVTSRQDEKQSSRDYFDKGKFKMNPEVYGFYFPEDFALLNVSVDVNRAVTFDFTADAGVLGMFNSMYKSGWVNFYRIDNSFASGGAEFGIGIKDGDTTSKETDFIQNDYNEKSRIIKSKDNLKEGTYQFTLYIENDRGLVSQYTGSFVVSDCGKIDEFQMIRVEFDSEGAIKEKLDYSEFGGQKLKVISGGSQYGIQTALFIRATLRAYNNKPVKLWLYAHVLDSSYKPLEFPLTSASLDKFKNLRLISEGTANTSDQIIINNMENPIIDSPFPSYNTSYKAELIITDYEGNQLKSNLQEASDFYYRMAVVPPAEAKGLLPIDNGWKEICISNNYKEEYVEGYYYSQNFFYDRIFSEITGEVSYENPIENKKRSITNKYLDKHTNFIYSYNGYDFVPYSTKIEDFQKEIVSKNVLKGVTPYIVKEDDFDYSILHQSIVDNLDALSEIESISTNAIKLGIDTTSIGKTDSTETSAVPLIEVFSNETIQLYRPELSESINFHLCLYDAYFVPKVVLDEEGNVKKDDNGNNIYEPGIVKANSTKTLQNDEFVIFYIKQDSDSEYYRAYYYGPGSIIQSQNKSLVATYTSRDSASIAASFVLGQAGQKKELQSFITDYQMTSDIKNKKSSIGSTWSVAVMDYNSDTLKDNINYCYWITNGYDDADQYFLSLSPVENTQDQYEYILQDGEYFIFTDQTKSLLNIRSTGTRLLFRAENSAYIKNLSVDKQTVSNIYRNGTSALADYWYGFDKNVEITVQAQEFINIPAGGTIMLEPGEGDTPETMAAKGIFFLTKDGLFKAKNESNAKHIDGRSDFTQIKDLVFNPENNQKVNSLYGFRITYTNPNEQAQVILNVDEATSWKIRTFLTLDVSRKQSQKFEQPGLNTAYIMEFKSATNSEEIDLNANDFEDGSIYLQSDSDLYCAGGDSLPTQQSYINGVLKYPSAYMYVRQSVNIENDDFKVTDYDDMINIVLYDDVDNKVICETRLLDGNYILPVQNYNGETIVYKMTGAKNNTQIKDLSIQYMSVDGTYSTTLTDFLSEKQDISLRKKYYMNFKRESVLGASNGNLAITMHRDDWYKDQNGNLPSFYIGYNMTSSISSERPQWQGSQNNFSCVLDLSQFNVNPNSPIHLYRNMFGPNGPYDEELDYSVFSYSLSSDGKLTINANCEYKYLFPYVTVKFLAGKFDPITIQILNLKRYSINEEIDKYNIKDELQKLDYDDEFNYLIEIDEGKKIIDPLEASSFNNYNHAYNEFTIGQSKIPQIVIQQ